VESLVPACRNLQKTRSARYTPKGEARAVGRFGETEELDRGGSRNAKVSRDQLVVDDWMTDWSQDFPRYAVGGVYTF